MGIKSFFLKLFGRKKVKLGLALGCGGAKGLALIGALRAFEEEGIKFDVVTGSSIGSVVGGMYAAGISSHEMLDYLKEYDLSNPKSLIMLKLKGYTTERLLSDITGGRTFDELDIPYSAIAADLDNGEEVDIVEGSVARAMCASCAIPPVFSAVTINGRRLVDGGYVNAVPASVARSLGADVVIGINLCSDDFNTEAKAALDKSYKFNNVAFKDRVKSGRENSDYFLEPDLNGYSTYAIGSFDPMYVIGYECAKEHMPEILKLLKKKKVKVNV